MNLTFDRYHDYAELTQILKTLEATYPDLCRLESIGKSHEGRDIWMLEVTNRKTAEGKDKPAVYADANTHAGEVTGCEVILYTIKMLVEGYGTDPQITRILDTRTFYFIPRITVDGSDYYLHTPYMLRSSMRPWPDEVDERKGLVPEDVDGNGKILTMRIPDPDGAWKVSDKDPRLMVKRRPDETGGTYYSVYAEGRLVNGDVVVVKQAPPRYGIDFNRNYPTNWALPVRQRGSGDYPFSEPEMKAVGDFYVSHPNIVTSMAYHTSGGWILRPLCTRRESEMPQEDREIYRAVGERAEEITGYPARPVFEWFTLNQDKPEVGSDLEWVYETLGILAFETELWDMAGRAGIPKRPLYAYRGLSDKEREEEALKLLKWNDEAMGGKLFHPWRPFDHPDFGLVEIGGWEPKFGRQNPPLELLEEEIKKNAPFNLTRALITPLLVVQSFQPEALGEGLYKLEAVIKNEGYLPTHVTFQALKLNAAKPVRVRLELSGGAELVSGKDEFDVGHLGGRAGGGDHKKKFSWVVRSTPGGRATITAWCPRAGKARREVVLG